MVDFKAVGISYHDTPLEIRELVAFSENEIKDFLLKIRDTFGLNEALVVSTCNRTEVYYSASTDKTDKIVSLIASYKCISSDSFSEYIKDYSSSSAIEHLFDVSLGLDSKVLGDIQISNQIKRAYQVSADLDMAGPFLHRLLHTIFYANKRVVMETQLQDGNASVASVAVDFVKRFIDKIEGPKIAIIGLGEIGQNVLDNLREVEASIHLVNRTRSKAEKLAVLPNHIIEDYENKISVIHNCDVVICSVSEGSTIITKKDLESNDVLHKLLIDLSVPRSITEDIEDVPGVSLYNIDQLSEKTEKAKGVRKKAIPEAKEIISEAIDGFNDWKEEMEVSPTIQKLKNTLEDIRKQELARHTNKVTPQEMDLLEVVTKSMIQKVIKLPVLQLKAACRRGESETLVGVLNDLFNLEKDEVKRD